MHRIASLLKLSSIIEFFFSPFLAYSTCFFMAFATRKENQIHSSFFHSHRDNSISAGLWALVVKFLMVTAKSILDQSVHRGWYWNIKHTCQSSLCELSAVWIPSFPLADKGQWVDMSARDMSGKATVDGLAGGSTLPVSLLSVYRFGSEFLYLKTAFCITAFDKALAPADRSRYAPAPPIEKLIRDVKCQPVVRLCQTLTHMRHLTIK